MLFGVPQSFIFFNYFSDLFSRLLLHSIVLICLCTTTFAQDRLTGNSDWFVKPVISSGFVMVHRVSIGHLVKGYPTTYELNVAKPTSGSRLWHLENNKPDIGVSLQCMDYRNPTQLGYGLTAAPFIEIPLNERARASRVILRMCWGVTYMTRSFDIRKNHKNIAIGSHVNAFVQFRWLWHLKLGKHLRFEPGITFSHASNGKAKNPNLGLNVLSLSAGLNYLIQSKKEHVTVLTDSSTKARSKNELLLTGAVGFNQRTIGSPGLRTYLFSPAYQRNVRNTHKFSAGLDIYYDEHFFVDYEEQLKVPPQGMDRWRVAAKIGYAYNVGRFSFPFEAGYYIYQKAQPDGNIVSRLGIKYYAPGGVVVHFGLRTHFAVAYAFEYGLGYRLSI